LPKVATLVSPTLMENAKLILKVSHNLGADLLPLQIALKNGKNTFEDGVELEKKYLNQLGVKTSEIVINDGMGSGPNFISPEVVIQLLSGMYKVPYFQQYLNAQPILGIDAAVDASLYEKMSGPARGHVYAKTGTIIEGDLLNQRAYLFTQGLAGYIKTAKNKMLVFVAYVNNVPLASVDQSMDVAKDVSKLTEIIYAAE
jgi:serine-type D-Ala-D-Ala carboxypeptidase/endopeptidase (penicillin-binding protein 4)